MCKIVHFGLVTAKKWPTLFRLLKSVAALYAQYDCNTEEQFGITLLFIWSSTKFNRKRALADMQALY